ncbi:MAG: xanthine dehydrogenase family protein subunit M [Candidatus Poribacteria bacterium]|nr:xanthine dehydrogenase family protein subunit M [Candidatus Poribacteria bacterium]
MRNFEFFEPTTVEEASSLLAQYNGKARLLAGGTDLIIGMKARTEMPEYVISLENIPGLDGITYDEGSGLRVGAMTKMRALETDAIIRDRYTALAEGAAEVGSIQIRHLATLGGNIGHASPAADAAAALLVLDAQVQIGSADGQRTVPIDALFTGPGTTVLEPGEIITAFEFPPRPANSGSQYLKQKIREVMDLAFVGVASAVTLNDGAVENTRIGLAAVAPTPIRATEAEGIINRYHPVTKEILEQAAEAASAQSRPISDLRCSAEYRRQIVGVLTRRTVQTAINRAQS